MDRMSLDLGVARDKIEFPMKEWKYLFVGQCTGDALIALGSRKGSPLDPTEFDKLTGIEEYKYLYVTNTAQTGKILSIYFEETEKIVVDGVEIRKD
jgi:hypothetical protein